jgi:hypothetical protein
MSEPSSDMDQEPTDDQEPNLACYLSFHLNGEDLIFDAAWSDKEALKKLAHIIYLIQNSDFIMSQIKEMDTENPEDVEELEKIIDEINNAPAILPLEVFRD